MKFVAGLDLGQSNDFTALCVIERVENIKHNSKGVIEYDRFGLPIVESVNYHGRHLQRFDLGTSYPAIVEKVKQLMQVPQLRADCSLVVDYTGVGRPVVDMLGDAGLAPIPVSITSGLEITEKQGEYGVPKRDLIFGVVSALQDKKLTFAKSLPDAPVLIKELLNYQIKVTEHGNDTYNAREGTHDDLVLAVALALWWCQRGTQIFV